MKTKVLVKKMPRQEASSYMDSSKYRFPTKEEVVLYSEDSSTTYWYSNEEEVADTEFPLYAGQFVYGREYGKEEVNKQSYQQVLCVEDGSFELHLRQVLVNYKIGDICMDEAIETIKEI